MPNLGGFSTFPWRLGGGADRRLRALYTSLNQQLGTAYDTTDDSTVVPETHAEARLLERVWSGNQRVANQFDPVRMTDMLPRWERIFGIPARAGDTDAARRARVGAKFAALGGNPNSDGVQTVVAAALGALLVGIEYTPLGSAVSHWAGTGEPGMWTSTCAHILIRVVRPTSGVFSPAQRAALGSLMLILNDFLPAWTTVDWAGFSSAGVGEFRFDEPDFDVETWS